MDYEITWRKPESVARRLRIVRESPRSEVSEFVWVLSGDYPEHTLRLNFPKVEDYIWLCRVPQQPKPEEREALENFARAKYGL